MQIYQGPAAIVILAIVLGLLVFGPRDLLNQRQRTRRQKPRATRRNP